MSETPEPRKFLVTGPPGVGKTTLILRLEEYFQMRGLKPAGMVTQEVRAEGERVGFKLRDIATGQEGWLAKKGDGNGPKIGNYTVEAADLDNIGVRALETALEGDADVVLVDEIGPMEMTSRGFRKAISDLFASEKMLVATLRYESHYAEVEEGAKQRVPLMAQLTRENRDETLKRLASQIEDQLNRGRIA